MPLLLTRFVQSCSAFAAAGDIDTLVVVPRDIKREDFFDTFLNMLIEHSKGDAPKVKELHVSFSCEKGLWIGVRGWAR